MGRRTGESCGLLAGAPASPLPSLGSKPASSRGGDAWSGGLLEAPAPRAPPLPSRRKPGASRGDASSDGGGVWYSSPACDEGDGSRSVSSGGGGAGAGTDTSGGG